MQYSVDVLVGIGSVHLDEHVILMLLFASCAKQIHVL